MSKSKSAKSAATVARPTCLSSRLASAGGRFVGVTTISGNKTRKFNGQIRSVTPNYVTMFDRNQKRAVKFALNSVVSVTGV